MTTSSDFEQTKSCYFYDFVGNKTLYSPHHSITVFTRERSPHLILSSCVTSRFNLIYSPGIGVPLALPVSAPFNLRFFFFFLGMTAGFEPYSPSVRCVEQVKQIAPSGGEQKTIQDQYNKPTHPAKEDILLKQMLHTKPTSTTLR